MSVILRRYPFNDFVQIKKNSEQEKVAFADYDIYMIQFLVACQ